ncbi:MAG: 30S ribosomal protein S17 [Thaumarchaeota archaeon]|nr:30S ribosomal protein S17 [Nitrososphaerota archaeon]
MSSAGLQLAPPKRTCDDVRCPFHGHVKVRGKILTGKVVSISDKQTVVLQREYLQKVAKYNRYERRRGKLHAHLPPCIELKEGDTASVAECRPLSKTISFVVVQSRRFE